MKYQHILMAGLALTSSVTLTGCLFEDDDKFDESAALRIEHYADEVQTLLCSAENGWVMEYFPNSSSQGYTMLCKFEENGTVTFASDHEYLRNGQSGKYTEAKSLYEILKEDGPVLSFNTWNDVFTIFADPVDPTTGNKDGYGLEGDHNLVILSSSSSEIKLRGERQSGETRMYPAPADWQQYLKQVSAAKSYFYNNTITGFTLSNGTDTLYCTGLKKGILTVGDRLVDPIVSYQVPFITSVDGVHFQFPYTLGGVSGQDFTINADSSALVTADGTMSFAPIWQSYAATHMPVWQLDTTAFTPAMLTAYHNLESAIVMANKSWTLKYLGFGKNATSSGLSYCFYLAVETNKTSGKVTMGGLGLTAEYLGNNTARYTAQPNLTDNNFTTFAKKNAEVTTYATELLSYVEGDYVMVPNNYFYPSGGTFTALDGSKTLVFK
jgi:hypothetical protein